MQHKNDGQLGPDNNPSNFCAHFVFQNKKCWNPYFYSVCLQTVFFFNLAQIITLQMAKLGPDNNSTACIYIYIFIYIIHLYSSHLPGSNHPLSFCPPSFPSLHSCPLCLSYCLCFLPFRLCSRLLWISLMCEIVQESCFQSTHLLPMSLCIVFHYEAYSKSLEEQQPRFTKEIQIQILRVPRVNNRNRPTSPKIGVWRGVGSWLIMVSSKEGTLAGAAPAPPTDSWLESSNCVLGGVIGACNDAVIDVDGCGDGAGVGAGRLGAGVGAGRLGAAVGAGRLGAASPSCEACKHRIHKPHMEGEWGRSRGRERENSRKKER